MKIGVVGLGVVGDAVYFGFECLCHEMSFHDIARNTTIQDVLDTELCFICVPSPSKESGECDTSIVESVVRELKQKAYQGIICVKSTVSPGTTLRLQEQYKDDSICFVPEFLRERCAAVDFTSNHDVCVIGTRDKEVFEKVKEAHGHLPDKFVMMGETDAELCKYFNNVYNATLVTFANSFYEVCQKLGADYDNVKADALHSHFCI